MTQMCSVRLDFLPRDQTYPNNKILAMQELYMYLYHSCNILTNQIAALEVSCSRRHLLEGFLFYKTLFSEAT